MAKNTTQKLNSIKQLNSWFEIDEQEYMWYILKGYEIRVRSHDVVWILNGKFHREDGPAIIYFNGIQEWWLNDIPYSQAKFNEAIKQLV